MSKFYFISEVGTYPRQEDKTVHGTNMKHVHFACVLIMFSLCCVIEIFNNAVINAAVAVIFHIRPTTMRILHISSISRRHNHTLHPRIPMLKIFQHDKIRPSVSAPITSSVKCITEVKSAIQTVADLLKDSRGKVVVLTGAGIKFIIDGRQKVNHRG